MQPYKYNGKELDTQHGLNMYDYSARYYEPAIGRFTSVDPLAEKYYSISPYVYVGNNPMRFIDPDGKDWRDFLKGIANGIVGHHPGKAIVDQSYTSTIAKPIKDGSPRETGNSDFETGYVVGEVITFVAEAVVGGAVISSGKGALRKGTEKVGKEVIKDGIERGVVKSGAEKTSKSYGKKTFDAFEKQLKEHGEKSIQKSRSKIERRLNEHKDKLKDINESKGHGSSVEREINTFQKQLDAIDDLLKTSK